MGTISNKLDYLKDTKSQIKEALIAKHATVSDTDTFRSYADKIKTIPQVNATLIKKTITENGTYIATSEKDVTKCDGYSSVTVNVKGKLVEKTITKNGTYYPKDDKATGYSKIIVNVKSSGGFTGIIVSPVLISDDIATTA